MSRETEKALRAIKKGMEAAEEEKLSDFLEFMKRENGDFNSLSFTENFPYLMSQADSEESEAYGLLELAQDAETPAEAIRYAKKALKLDPGLLDAELIIVTTKDSSLGVMQKDLEKLLKKGEQQLRQQGITPEEDAGDYYGLLETRPYMRVCHAYIDVLTLQNKLRRAAEAAENALHLNDNDNLGIRYNLMAIYAALEDQEKAESLYNRYPGEDTAFLLLPLIALYYKLDDEKTARRYLKKLCSKTEGAIDALKLIEDDAVDMDALMNMPYYQPYTKQEILMSYGSSPFLYEPILDFVPWVIQNCPSKKQSAGKMK